MTGHRDLRARACALVVALLVSGAAGSREALAGSYNVVTVDYGSGYQTLLYGINDNGLLSGDAYNASTGYNTGVLFNGGMATLVVAPGANETEFYQVNNSGQVAVSYYGADGIYHAAVYNSAGQSWTNLPDIPGYAENLAGGINKSGTVLGDPFINTSYQGGVGWTWNGTSYSFFSAPGADPTQAGTATYSINDAGQAVGYFQDTSSVYHGYIKTGSTFTQLDDPGAHGYTSAQGINNLGVVTGTYTDVSGAYNGFIWNNGQFTTFDVPGAMGTDITAINDQGELAGWYIDANGAYHGFVATAVPEPGTATLTLLGVVGLALFLRHQGERKGGIRTRLGA